jgi:hypothetical protein
MLSGMEINSEYPDGAEASGPKSESLPSVHQGSGASDAARKPSHQLGSPPAQRSQVSPVASEHRGENFIVSDIDTIAHYEKALKTIDRSLAVRLRNRQDGVASKRIGPRDAERSSGRSSGRSGSFQRSKGSSGRRKRMFGARV